VQVDSCILCHVREVLGPPFGQASIRHQSGIYHPYPSASLKNQLQYHGAQTHDSTPRKCSTGQDGLAAISETAVKTIQSALNLPVCVPMNHKLSETPASIGKEFWLSGWKDWKDMKVVKRVPSVPRGNHNCSLQYTHMSVLHHPLVLFG